MTDSVFAKYIPKAYPFRYTADLHFVGRIIGGVPSDPRVAEAWLRKKLAVDNDVLLEKMVAEVMAERGVAAEEAIEDVIKRNNLNGFKRDEKDGGLYIEGRQAKAMLKEAASVAGNAGKLNLKGWGTTNKGLISWFPEHVFVLEDRIPLGVYEPSGPPMQRFVQTWRGSAIQYEEFVEQPDISFTVGTDFKLTDEQWAMIWLTAQELGLGATRSMGYGRFRITRWELLK